MVIDPIVAESLKDHRDGSGTSQHDRLVEFLAAARAAGWRVREADSKEALKRAFRPPTGGRPDVMYWLCHADPEMLQLGADRVSQTDLNNLLRGIKTGRATNGLVILNACRTAEPGGLGSFLKSFHDHNYCGIIATEERTLDTLANPFGLDLLRGFLGAGEPIGRLLRGLRRRNVPLGLLYGTYCPAHLAIRKPEVASESSTPDPLAAVALPTARPAASLATEAQAAPQRRTPAGGRCPRGSRTCRWAHTGRSIAPCSPAAMPMSSGSHCSWATPRRGPRASR